MVQHRNHQMTACSATGTIQPGSQGAEYTANDGKFINDLFGRLAVIFPAWKTAFKNADQVNEAKREWLEGLVENNITSPELIEAGFKGCRRHNSPFLPSIGMFVEWAEDARIVDVPTQSEAYAEFTRWFGRSKELRIPAELHPVVWWVRNQLSDFDWSQMKTVDHRRAFREHYLRAIEKAKKGYHFSTPPKLLTKKEERKEADPIKAQAAYEKEKEFFVNLFKEPDLTYQEIIDNLEAVNSKEDLEKVVEDIEAAIKEERCDYTAQQSDIIENTIRIENANFETEAA